MLALDYETVRRCKEQIERLEDRLYSSHKGYRVQFEEAEVNTILDTLQRVVDAAEA